MSADLIAAAVSVGWERRQVIRPDCPHSFEKDTCTGVYCNADDDSNDQVGRERP